MDTALGAVASSGSAVRCKQEKAAPAPLSAGLGRAGPCCRHRQQHGCSSATLGLVRPAACVPRRARANEGGVLLRSEEAIRQASNPTIRSATEMENHVFQKARSKDEYLSYVARLIIHVREMRLTQGPKGSGHGVPVSPYDDLLGLQCGR
ncbi:hypothetical protein IscW_ISCW010765 [Ixodes scapularis]|uniref:Mediator of RNA polymerase II transcription subunit 15 n=1 Tax=Ixodes scapularis TaxID=6945 RepID=B7Q504_IXOSC|nr:hypothetical protein IscW_ISCW010765 [Ixodes scapularis]|eukprot:XP_002401271.1 hypothetical protein IscW_ISCW010765 [Ixodes scapularis]